MPLQECANLLEVVVHLAYLDDSSVEGSIALFGGIVVPTAQWGWAERLHGIAIEQLFQRDEFDEKFKEFHACDLYQGRGPFAGIDEKKRFDAIAVLLSAVRNEGFPFIYGAVDEKKLEKSSLNQDLFGTARPLTAAFRLCLLGVEEWSRERHRQFEDRVAIDYKDNFLVIVDDTSEVDLKRQLRSAYRTLRIKHPYRLGTEPHRLWHCHDEMYFSNSVDCIGVQLADLCAYFTQRRLLKRNKNHREKADEFFEMIAPFVKCAKPEPEWSRHKEFLLSHDYP